MNKNVLVSAGIVIALVLGVVGILRPATVERVVQNIGANPGPEFFVPVFFRETSTDGGNVFATTSAGSVTYTAASLIKTSLIAHTASAAVTATLPASSTIASAFVPLAGDSRTIYLAPITTNITLAGGTGTDLNTASSTKVCLQGTVCSLEFVRKSNSDIEVLLVTPTGN